MDAHDTGQSQCQALANAAQALARLSSRGSQALDEAGDCMQTRPDALEGPNVNTCLIRPIELTASPK